MDDRLAKALFAIAAAFQRHIDEHHGADFEVCADADCQRAVALEAGIEYPD